ncbi:hypothetical protein FGB62_2g52 [Gracilaria domingensis]|nr:hypothetical protein FGB62_2g52 [Gracilaria domingensis]
MVCRWPKEYTITSRLDSGNYENDEHNEFRSRQDRENPELQILPVLDKSLFHKPNRMTAAQAAGSLNEENILRSLCHACGTGFEEEASDSPEHWEQKLSALVTRGLVQAKFGPRFLSSVEAIAAIKTRAESDF